MSVEDGNKPKGRPLANDVHVLPGNDTLVAQGAADALDVPIRSGLTRGTLQYMSPEAQFIPSELCSSQKLGIKNQDADPVNHPSHYTSHPARCRCGASIECIQVTEHMGFNLGNVVKYLWRNEKKGTPLEDLKKAAWYLAREIQRREKDLQN